MPFVNSATRKRARRRIAAHVRAGEPCHLCQQPIDLELRWPHPESFVVDHIVPTSRGGTDDYELLAPAHHLCNGARSNQPLGSVGLNSGVLE